MTLLSMEAILVHAYISLLGAIVKWFSITGFLVEFYKVERPLLLNGLLTSERCYGMLEGKGYHSTNVMLPFTCKYMDKATVYTEKAEVIKVNAVCSTILHEMYFRSSNEKRDF